MDSEVLFMTITPLKVGGSEYNHWVLVVSLPNQQLKEEYDDYLEMKERINELLRCYRYLE